MAYKRMVVEMGMGTDLQGGDYTKAAVRALRDALWHNSLTVAPAFGLPREAMKVEVNIARINESREFNQCPLGDILLPWRNFWIGRCRHA